MTVVERAYAELRARLIDLRLRPGQPIHELALAAELGMGRGTIQEALLRLQTEGLVDAGPRRGFVVTVPTVEALRELYEVVGALEGMAVRRAARASGPILVGALSAAIEAQEAALIADDADGWARADRRFHDLLRESALNRHVQVFFRLHDGQLQRARAATRDLRQWSSRSTEEHRAILSAIHQRDEALAVRLLHEHRQRADADMLTAIHQYTLLLQHPSPSRPAVPAGE